MQRELVQQAVAAMPHTSLLVVDRRLRVQSVTGTALAAYGITARLVGRVLPDALPPHLAFRATALVSRALEGAEVWDATPWGPEGAHEATYTPVVGDGGEVAGCLVTVRAAGPERRAADALVALSEQRRAAVDTAGDVLATFDAAGRFAWVSDSIRPLTGWAPGELIGRNPLDLLHPEDASRTRDVLRPLYRGAGETTAEYRYRRRDGEYVWLQARVRALPGQRGEVQGLVSAVRDISGRKEGLAASGAVEDAMAAAFAAAPGGMGVVAVDGTWTLVNAALADLLGRSPEDLRARPVEELAEPVDRFLVAGLVRDVLDSGAQGQAECGFVRPDGRAVRVALAASVARDLSGATRFVVLQAEDVTQRRSAQDELLRRAYSDPLTGLPNRSAFFDRLRHALAAAPRRRVDVGVVFIDLEGFKLVNDSLGHAAGDEVLQLVGARLREAVREEDTVARLGGDEFAVLCEAVTAPEAVDVLVERLRASVDEPVTLATGPVRVGLTTGVAVGVGVSAEELLRRADEAMYAQKPGRVLDLR
ncbi:sensor domain-containing protein [Motilibacter rhizosphaerae]|nr:diguanylate cyclase [Motilibacter rhizosphaerae]